MRVVTREQTPPDPLRLEKILQALGDPVRLGIVRHLAREGESSCAALDGGRPKSTMSHHFKVLREAGLVRTRHQGVTHMNALCRAAVDAAFPGLLDVVIDAERDRDDVARGPAASSGADSSGLRPG